MALLHALCWVPLPLRLPLVAASGFVRSYSAVTAATNANIVAGPVGASTLPYTSSAGTFAYPYGGNPAALNPMNVIHNGQASFTYAQFGASCWDSAVTNPWFQIYLQQQRQVTGLVIYSRESTLTPEPSPQGCACVPVCQGRWRGGVRWGLRQADMDRRGIMHLRRARLHLDRCSQTIHFTALAAWQKLWHLVQLSSLHRLCSTVHVVAAQALAARPGPRYADWHTLSACVCMHFFACMFTH